MLIKKYYIPIQHLYRNTNIRNKIIDSHVVVLPSYREGFARVLMEAQACARPVITSDISGCRDVIVDKGTGFLVKRDKELFSKKIEQLLLDRELRNFLGSSGLKHTKSKWSWDKSAAQINKKLKEMK